MPYYPNFGAGISVGHLDAHHQQGGGGTGYVQDQIGGRPRTISAIDVMESQRDQLQTNLQISFAAVPANDSLYDTGVAGAMAFQEQQPPYRIARPFNPGLNMWAGISQWGARQWNHRTRIRPPVSPPFVTRGLRSVSGVAYAGTPRTTGQFRVPAIYVPTSIG